MFPGKGSKAMTINQSVHHPGLEHKWSEAYQHNLTQRQLLMAVYSRSLLCLLLWIAQSNFCYSIQVLKQTGKQTIILVYKL